MPMRRALLCSLLLSACSTKSVPPVSPEATLRAELGVPTDAQYVVVFSQSSHLDVDWQKTFDDYYTTWVSDILLQGRALTEEQPRAFYSVAEMSFLKHHLDVHPDELPRVKAQVARGAFRVVGGGMTSPDTLLPETELLLRDYLYGLRFAEQTLGTRPTAAWLPDSFGHSPTAPDVLQALGFQSVGFGRLDGAPTFVEELSDPQAPLKPGSSAERLQQLGTADFIWRGAGGGTVQAHWINEGVYCLGDNIDYDEPLPVPGGHIGPFVGDDHDKTDQAINLYVHALRPFAKTPYLFVPVGCDFQAPKQRLLEYLDGYNQRQYPRTHAWAVAASFDQYEALVRLHPDATPTLDLDGTPYFMGFYGTRPDIKRGTRDAARGFFSAEPFAALLKDDGPVLEAAAAPALEELTKADHHDFITGTANDQVTAQEQRVLLAQARVAGEAALKAAGLALGDHLPAFEGVGRVVVLNPSGETVSGVVDAEVHEGVVHAEAPGGGLVLAEPIDGGLRLAVDALPPFSWRAYELKPGAQSTVAPQVSLELLDGAGQPTTEDLAVRVVLSNAFVRAQWDKVGDAFALTRATLDGVEALKGPSFTFADYADQGGLYRLGHEMKGCTLDEEPPDAGGVPEAAHVLEQDPFVVRVGFVGGLGIREARLDSGDHLLRLALTSVAPEGVTRDVAFQLDADGGVARTSLAGGYADRGADRVYSPTWWPAVEWASAGPWALLLRQSTGVRFGPAGRVELMAVRDVRSEKCDILGGVGSDPDAHRIEWALARADTPAQAARAAQAFNRPLAAVQTEQPTRPTFGFEGGVLSYDGEGVVTAVKPAERGTGVVVRALLSPGPVTLYLPPALANRQAVRVDAAERDLERLGKVGTSLVLDKAHFGAIASVRLVPP